MLSFGIQEVAVTDTIEQGTGKTSISRILAKLWPTFDGIVRRPNKGEIMFLPQRPYLSLGSLRDQ